MRWIGEEEEPSGQFVNVEPDCKMVTVETHEVFLSFVEVSLGLDALEYYLSFPGKRPFSVNHYQLELSNKTN